MPRDTSIENLTRELFRKPTPVALLLASGDKDDLETSVTASIQMIEDTSKAVHMLQSKVEALEGTVYDLNQDIGQSNHDRDRAVEQLIAAKQTLQGAENRASKLEVQLSSANERIKSLEQKNTSLRAQVEKLVQAVTTSFAAKGEGDMAVGDHTSMVA
jgi:chromosome segregation ATPase